ncbi:MAG: hypothetical protein A2808_01010 [Candidatus Moranbacteria bacterium RIFCSPHIGHO2_01_FULL_55_24]|nr:MAG: hypothetical protein A2808_01010 [Candidatus Moranbacteria bacterium RIFCSPHIGHO2_01_FULL_55_24]
MSKAIGYSLWLVPDTDSQAYLALSERIKDIALKYQTPLFEPHVTLLGGIQDLEKNVREKTQTLSKTLKPLEIQTCGIDSYETYFQALFLKVKKTPEIMQIYEESRQHFGLPEKEHFPHLSIAYGEFALNDIQSLQAALESIESVFFAKTIELWRTEGETKQWTKLETFFLEQ